MIELLATLATIAGLFIWNRSESRNDIRHMDNKLEAIRELSREIHLEIKDFHNRLLDIERRKNNDK